MINGRLAESAHTVAARVVLLFHQHVETAVLRQQTDGLAVAEALLRAIAVLIAVFSDLEITREIYDFPDHGFRRTRIRFPIDGGAEGGGTPRFGRFLAEFAHGLLVGAA